MTSGQKYDGKENSATPNPQEAKKTSQTAGNNAQPSKPTFVAIGDYFEQVTANREAYEGFQELLQLIFVEGLSNPRFIFNYKGEQKQEKAQALYRAIAQMIHGVATQKLTPEADRPTVAPAPDELHIQPHASNLYMQNPYNYTDVEQLQGWVKSLQSGSELLMKLRDTLLEQQQVFVDQKELQDQRIESNEKINALQAKEIAKLNDTINELKAKLASSPPLVPPSLSFEIDIPVSLVSGNSHLSEFDVLQFALTQFRDARFNDMLLAVGSGDTERAYYEYEQFKQISDFLDGLASSLSDQHDRNHIAKSSGYTIEGKQKYDRSIASGLSESYSDFITLLKGPAPKEPTDEAAN